MSIKETQEKFDISTHIFVPKHFKLSDEEKQKLLDKYNISEVQLPKISKSDPAIQKMEIKSGDVIKIIRNSPTVGEMEYYRIVANV